MHPSESVQEGRCAQCGVHITTSAARTYPFGEDRVLCFECAVARGGVHDIEADRWTSAPEVGELTLERDV